MTQLHRINAIQKELRDVLRLSQDDYRLEIGESGVGARYLGLQLRSAFQPIIDLHSMRPIGNEALLRATDQKGGAVAALAAFRQAEVAESLVKFDRLCRTLHTLNYLNMGVNDLLFLNVHPELLVAVHEHGKVFEQVLHQHDVPTQHVVIEINESAVADKRSLDEAIRNYRQCGYKISIDNFGKRHFDLERLWHLSPDFVKLDPVFIKGLEGDALVQKLLPKLVDIIRAVGTEVIAVGIETSAQQQITQQAGINLAQGFWLGKPLNA